VFLAEGERGKERMCRKGVREGGREGKKGERNISY
jgi:hypothetical protein